MKHHLLSTKAKRKALAARVARIASDRLGIPIELTPDALHPGEFSCRLEKLETTRGPLSHLHLDVCTRGVNVHTKFGFPEFAPPGANRHSGKWNHYIWPRGDESAESYTEMVEAELTLILSRIELTGAERADRPGITDYWAYEREQFAKQRTA